MCAPRYWGLLQRRVAPSRPLRCTNRHRPPPPIHAMLTSTRLTRPTASLPVLQSTSRERPESWIRRLDAFRFRPLMLDRGSLPTTEHPFAPLGVLPLPPGVFPPPPPGVLPAPVPGRATCAGGPTLK